MHTETTNILHGEVMTAGRGFWALVNGPIETIEPLRADYRERETMRRIDQIRGER